MKVAKLFFKIDDKKWKRDVYENIGVPYYSIWDSKLFKFHRSICIVNGHWPYQKYHYKIIIWFSNLIICLWIATCLV